MKPTTKFQNRIGLKVLTMAFFLVTGTLAGAQTRTEPLRIIANPGDFAVLNSVQSSKVTVFLSYAGEQWDHCGITVRFSRFGPTEEFNRQFSIKDRDGVEIGEIDNGRIIAKVHDRTAKLFGEMFDIETRSGQNIGDVLQSLDSGAPADTIVELLTCQ